MVDEVVGRGIIEVVGDATNFSAAMAQVAQAAGQVEKKLVDTAQSIGETFTQAEQSTSAVTNKVTGTTKRFIDSITREIATLQLSRDSYRTWEAQVKNIPESVYTPYIAKLNEARAAQEAQAKSLKEQAAAELQAAAAKRDSDRNLASQNQFIAGLREQVALYGKNTEQVLAYRAAQAGVLAQAQPLITQLQNQRAAQDLAAEAAKREAQAQREAAAAKTTQDNFIQSLRAQSEAIGKTQADLLELKAAQLGLTKDAAPYIARLRESEGALRAGGKALNEYGLTAGQTRAALRQVPAQITDIVVSLQGGTAPLTVLLQQGGQLKDVFGGVKPAAQALGGALLNLINPYTAVAAAAAALVVGYAKGSVEADKYRNAILLTGNAAGTTVGDLGAYAVAIDNVRGTQFEAAEALTLLVETTRVARGDLQKFAQVAIDTQKATGKAVADTVKEFSELGKDPVEASKRLNEQTNFLTLGVYQQIKALQEQGKTTEAASLAQRTYADELSNRTGQITANLGLIERGWRAIKSATLEAGDALLNVGRRSTGAQRVAELQAELNGLNAPRGLVGSALQRPRAQIEADIKAAEREAIDARVRASNRGIQARTNQEAISAEGEISRIRKDSATNTQKLNKELEAYRRNLDKIRAADPKNALLDPAAIARDEANIRERFKERGGSARTRAVTDDAATRRLQQLRETEASLRMQLSVDEKLTGSQRELAEFTQLIADLKEKRILTADQKSLLASQAAIKSQLEANVVIEKALEKRKAETKELERQANELQKFKDRAASIQESALASNASRGQANADRLGAFGQGARAREEVAGRTAVIREYDRYLEQLRKASTEETRRSDAYIEAEANIRLAREDALAQTASYFDQLRTLQANWINGAEEALQNYVDNTKDLSGAIGNLFEGAFKRAEDSLVSFAKTGKLSFKDLGDFILDQILRIIVQQQVLGPIAAALGGGGMASGTNSAGGLIGTFFSSLFGGGRAIGGPVAANRMYSVNENGPEMLNVQGRQFLMMGNAGGTVESTPATQGRPIQVTNQFYVSGPIDRRTQTQIAADAGRGVQRAVFKVA